MLNITSVEELLYEVFLLLKCDKPLSSVDKTKKKKVDLKINDPNLQSKLICGNVLQKLKNKNTKQIIKKNLKPSKEKMPLNKNLYLSGTSYKSTSIGGIDNDERTPTTSFELLNQSENIEEKEKTTHEPKRSKKNLFQMSLNNASTTFQDSGNSNVKDSYVHQNNLEIKKKLWECPICFEQSKGQEIVATFCGHVFCKNCIEEYSRKSKHSKCPACRSHLVNKKFITLYNF